MRWVNENLNPLGKQVGDCTVRAIAKATGKTWEEVYLGLSVEGYGMKDLPSSNAVWSKYLKRLGYKRRIMPDTCPDCYTVEAFCEDHPDGTYILALPSHVVCSIDGKYIDSWDSGQESIIFYWERSE